MTSLYLSLLHLLRSFLRFLPPFVLFPLSGALCFSYHFASHPGGDGGLTVMQDAKGRTVL